MSSRDLFDLGGWVAVVTGGSRGLGREMCLAFAAHGATVVVASRKLDACGDVVREIEAAGGRALAVAANVGRWDDCDRLVETVYAQLGRLDVLINNAGMSPRYDSLPDVSEALFDKVVAVNLRGPFRLASLAGTRMAAGDGGSIINVTSVTAVQPDPGELPYAAAKAGLATLTGGLARAFGPSVRVNAIMPGAFMTDISKAWDLEAFEAMARRDIVMRRGGEPNEIVGAALYLASDAASYTTGTTIKVDGGWVRAAG
jgi:NAD(P)-dependent dehydrogenase (short-subunit alcohol dehydrogenase family)